MIITSFIAYLNPLGRRGRLGILLTAQRKAVAQYVQERGGVILAEYLEAGHEGDFPELWKALAAAKKAEATLIMPSLSALYHCGKIAEALIQSGISIVAVDNPLVNSSTLHVLLPAAEFQTAVRSQRAREGLRAARERGVKLGSARPGHWRGKKRLREKILRVARERSAEVRSQNAIRANSTALKRALKYRAMNMNASQIARQLNSEGITTRRGKNWSCIQVQRLLGHAARADGGFVAENQRRRKVTT